MLIYLQMIDSDEDRSKFVFLYKKYKGLMFFVAHEILQNKNDAEDVVHHAFLTILKNLSKASKIVCQQGCFSPLLETQSQGIASLWTLAIFCAWRYPNCKNAV